MLIFGPAAAGKTSLLKTTMEKSSFMAVENLPPTRGISRETYLFRGLLEINAWDAGGQKIYQDRYYASQAQNVFSQVDIPVYMVDATQVDDTVRPNFDRFTEALLKYNPNVKMIYVLINKIDLEEAQEEVIHEMLIRDLPSNVLKKLNFTPVSVKQGSAQTRLIEIMDKVIDEQIDSMGKATKLRAVMEEFKNLANADFILFNKRDGLVMTSTFGKFTTSSSLQFVTFQISALESNIHDIYTRVMEMRESSITPLTFNTVILESGDCFVLAKEVEEKATLMAVTKDKETESLTKIIEIINDAHPAYEKLVTALSF
jgi:GTPase SAR1 family protein